MRPAIRTCLAVCLAGLSGGFWGCMRPVSQPAEEEPAVSLDVQIGQMLMAGFRGLDADKNSAIVRDVREGRLGGVVLYDYDVALKQPVRNILAPGQVKYLVSGLQRYARTPLFVAIDQEGGNVSRLKEIIGFPPTVSAEFLGKQDDLDLTRKEAGKIADTLAELGVNLNLAPVVDLNVNPESPTIGARGRSFSADPTVVTRHALAFIEAHHERGVVCALKHFPGHGSALGDTHQGATDVTGTWAHAELAPFANLIMLGKADAIMTAHIFNARLDPDYPATLSPRVLSGLLRTQLGFQGVIITDDLQMRAIADAYGLETAILLAIRAGADILLLANNSVYEEDVVARVAGIIKRLVEEKKIPADRITASWERIQRLKAQAFPDRHLQAPLSVPGRPASP